MRNILKYIPLHMEKNFLQYVSDMHDMTGSEVELSQALKSIAGEYLFKEKKGEEKREIKKIVKSEKEAFDDICDNKFSDVLWDKVTEIIHLKVRIPDSVIPVYALEIMYSEELCKRLVMRDHDKSLRFMSHVYSVWFSHDEQIH